MKDLTLLNELYRKNGRLMKYVKTTDTKNEWLSDANFVSDFKKAQIEAYESNQKLIHNQSKKTLAKKLKSRYTSITTKR